MNKWSRMCSVGSVACFLTLLVGTALAAEAGTASKRETIREERPDDSRGWMIVTKETYWPLCYESLDRIEEAIEQIGSDDREALADTLEKCGAWLRLAASAAMTDGKSGVVGASDRFIEAAESIHAGDSKLQDEDLHQIATLGLLCMAKSHLVRASESRLNRETNADPRASKSPSAKVAKAEKEANVERMEQRHAQRRHDIAESRKHLVVAQSYVNAAANAGGIAVDPALTATIPAVPAADFELQTYEDIELRETVESMLKFVDSERKALIKSIEGDL